MSGPARQGAFVYAKDVARLAAFYQTVLDLPRVRDTGELAVLGTDPWQLVIHAMPDAIAAGVTVATPPEPRAGTALKFFFSVDSLARAGEHIATHGGHLLPERYSGPAFVVANALDPEGNIFQLREFTA